jgi:hypothetical protein
MDGYFFRSCLHGPENFRGFQFWQEDDSANAGEQAPISFMTAPRNS